MNALPKTTLFLLSFLGLALLCEEAPAAEVEKPERFVAEWFDGTVEKSPTIENCQTKSTDEGYEDKGYKIDNASINNRRLFDPNNHVRIFQDNAVPSALLGPFVELANGDILPGGITPTDAIEESTLPIRMLPVAVSYPMTVGAKHQPVKIRLDALARIVFTKPNKRPLTPGLIVFTDGREIMAKRIKWYRWGIRILRERGLENAKWAELAEIHIPQPEYLKTILRDAFAQPPSTSKYLARLTVSNGAVLTYRLDRVLGVRKEYRSYHAVQPAWAEDALLILDGNIASVNYRKICDVPLSLLPAETLAERNLTGFTWHWQRNRNVRGMPLLLSGRRDGWGIGTHSYSEVAFTLPPDALSFSSLVGIDDIARGGGCVQCKIFLDKVEGKPAWTSPFLCGGEKPVRATINHLADAKRLILVTEFAETNAPANADPLDIGDVVAWQSAFVKVKQPRPMHETGVVDFSLLFNDWTFTKEMHKRIKLNGDYFWRERQWYNAFQLSTNKPLIATRKLRVNWNNAFLLTTTTKQGKNSSHFTVKANGEQVRDTEGGEKGGDHTTHCDYLVSEAFTLAKYLGQEVELSLAMQADRDDANNPAALIWDELALQPIIEGLPKSGQPIEPDVPLEAVTTLKIEIDEKAEKIDIKSGPLPTLWFCKMKSGVKVHPNVKEITCEIKPSWKRFVACIGPSEGSRGEIASFQVWVDDKLIWASGKHTRYSPGQQIDIPLHTKKLGKRLTLRVENTSWTEAIWANAGFMLE